MKKTLFINACVRPESRTLVLAKEVLKKSVGEIEEVNLVDLNLKPLSWELVEERDNYLSKKDFSKEIFKYARQFAAADEIVIATPYWDLSFPSIVRIYFEYATVCGITFEYTDEGLPRGLCKAKKITYVTTAGGPIGNYNLGYEYVKALAEAFYSIPKIECYKAENLDIIGADVKGILNSVIESL